MVINEIVIILVCSCFLFFLFRGLFVALKQESRESQSSIRTRQERYQELQHISDDEYVRLCSPGVDPSVALKVRNIIACSFNVNPALIRPDMPIMDLEWI